MLTRQDEPCLLLWDIDHTLIDTRGVGRRLYVAAFEAVTGVSMQHDVEVTGRTELAIFAETLRRHGIEANGQLTERYRTELAQQYEDNIDELRERGRVLPGASEALTAFAALPGTVQTVLTGNLRA